MAGIKATDAYIGGISVITINSIVAGTATLKCTFGSLVGYIDADGDFVTGTIIVPTVSSVAFTLPESFYDQIPDAKTGTCTLEYTAKSAAGATATYTTTFTVKTDPSVCGPTVSGTVVDTNTTTKNLTGNSNILVRGQSTAKCTGSASANCGASIKKITVQGGFAGGTGTFDITSDLSVTMPAQGDTFVFTATDSRGYSTTYTVTKTMVEYIDLTCNIKCTRDDPTSGKATLTIKGNYFSGSFGSKSNSLTLKYKIASGSYTAVTPTITDNTYSIDVALSDLAYDSAHSITVQAADQLATLAKTTTLQKGVPVADWGENDWKFNVLVTLAAGASIFPRMCSDCDNAIDVGFYHLSGADCLNYPTGIPGGNYGVLLVEKRLGNIYHTVKYNGYVAWRYSIRDENDINTVASWSEWEYENPPLVPGTEYRTTRRYNGKAIYTKAVDFGALPNATSKTVSCGVAGANVVSWRAVILSSTNNAGIFPWYDSSGNLLAMAYINSSGSIYVKTFSNQSAATAKFIVEYVKE